LESSPASKLEQFRQYLLDVRAEFEKISWPSRKEYVGGTIGVLVIVVFMTAVLGVLDAVLAAGFDWLVEGLPKLLNG
jgi:preprotein translocase subunit SecE